MVEKNKNQHPEQIARDKFDERLAEAGPHAQAKDKLDFSAGQVVDGSPAIIRQLTIERFRGIKTLKWNPAIGVNIILGGGDVGKTTILEAIALLLNPSNSAVLSDADYHNRDPDSGFEIQAVLSLPASSEVGQQQKFNWPWEWNGVDAVVPAVTDSESPNLDVPVYRFQVRGTSELELSWEIVQPNGDIEVLSSAVRRAIGVVRLGGDDRTDRDLRLVYGSALDRLLADQSLKARIGQQISEIDLNAKLSEDSKQALTRLDEALRKGLLPSGLELGLTSSQGISIGALIGLLAKKNDDTSLPLASWGAGTRRMATLKIASASQSSTRIAVIDEVERGLEPYRVRRLIGELQGKPTQCFVTTHSPFAINAATESSLWYLDSKGNIGGINRSKIKRQQDRDPETFLSRLAIIAEGATEVGFASHILHKAIKGSLSDHGIRVCDGQGSPAVLDLLEAMDEAGLTFGGFVDADAGSPNRWTALKGRTGNLLFRWDSGCTESQVISNVADDKLTDLVRDIDGDFDVERCKTLADRLGIQDRSVEAIVAKAADLRALIVAAATGCTVGAPDKQIEKTWKKHAQRWFKSEEGGRELAQKAETLGVMPKLKPALMPFLNSVRAFIGEPVRDDL